MALIYQNSKTWLEADNKKLMLFGMSGLGKTYLSEMLRKQAGWFHYSVDYRIGTRYMGEFISDSYKLEAMKNPVLAPLLRSDSLALEPKLSFNNLAPLSSYLGKPGNPDKGGIAYAEYKRRQAQHQEAEIRALEDTPGFVSRANNIYGYQNFVADTGGSICEVIDPFDANDPLMSNLAAHMLPVWIKGDAAQLDLMIERFTHAPKPMYYRPDFLDECWQDYLQHNQLREEDADPDEFIAQGYRKLVENRLPRYQAMADHWGITLNAADLVEIDPTEFTALVGDAIDARQ